MGSNDWGWITPDSLWNLVRPLLPPSRVRPQGCGTQDPPDEVVFAAIVCVLESGCAWLALPAPRRPDAANASASTSPVKVP
ncbi:hypothetical protein GCM10010103_77890 [Streptomyces paradoxus]|uniref:transposase n=1 Tax=Streptomyces paradoxus TaxID=66375 RepID=UPI00161661D5|nr:transposase [Streptomyces paradoxus]